MTGRQLRNIEGKLITRTGMLDQRATPSNGELPVNPDYAFDVVYKPGDSRPWHVQSTNLLTNVRLRVSRHTTERKAWQCAERLRLREPNRRPSVKQLHKAGIDQRKR